MLIKKSLLELVYSLIKCKGSIVSSDQLPLFLGAYNATLSPNDRLLLRIIYMHDFKFESGVPLQVRLKLDLHTQVCDSFLKISGLQTLALGRVSSIQVHPQDGQPQNSSSFECSQNF